MITMEDWVTIRNLKKKNPGMSLRDIGRLLGISHNTVKKALLNEAPPEYKRASVTSKVIKPFEEVIFEMANVKKYKGSRIFNEIVSKGYSGGKTTFYEHLTRIRQKEQKSFTPYETAPGEQSQFDWSPYTVLIGGEVTKIYLYSYINSFSRYQILEVSLSENQGAVLEALENSILESGGVPARVQTDNAKVFVKNASKNNFQWNTRYLRFCGHYGFEPTRSLPKHPWSKGKVEKPFSYIEDHFIAGSSFESFEHLVFKMKDFQKELNQRTHSTIKRQPAEAFEDEKPSLLKLPQNRYVGIKEELRKANFDCLISFSGSRYSVPWPFAGKHVWIRVSKGYYLEVYSQSNKLVARHKLALKKSSIVIEEQHFRGNNYRGKSFDLLKKSFLDLLPDHDMFIEKLKAQKRINTWQHLSRIMELSKFYRKEDFQSAVETALKYNVFTYSLIAGYLEKNFRHTFDIKTVKTKKEYEDCNIKRNLNEYRIENY